MEILRPYSFEQGSYVVQCDFTDELGQAATPLSAVWTLYDGAGVVVNGREGVAIPSLSSTVYIAMSGDDLATDPDDAYSLSRVLVVSGTYQSAVVGSSLPFTSAVKYRIEDLPL